MKRLPLIAFLLTTACSGHKPALVSIRRELQIGMSISGAREVVDRHRTATIRETGVEPLARNQVLTVSGEDSCTLVLRFENSRLVDIRMHAEDGAGVPCDGESRDSK
jgi:hypothetical protein